MIDARDKELLTFIQEDGRISNAELGRRLGLAPSAILERVRKLEARGVICGYSAKIAPRALDLGLLAFVFIRAEELPGETRTGDALAAVPEVLEVHHVAGEDCYLAKVRAADTKSLGVLLRQRFGAIPTVRSTRTTIVLDTVKETAELPIQVSEREPVAARA